MNLALLILAPMKDISQTKFLLILLTGQLFQGKEIQFLDQ